MKKFIVLIFVLILVITGCGRPAPINPGKIYDNLDEEIVRESNSTDTIEEKEKKVAELEARLAAAEADLRASEKAAMAAKLRRIQTMAYWMAGICGAVGLLCTAIFIILMIQGICIGRKLIVAIGIASYAVACVSLFAGKYIEYWQWVGGGLLLSGVIYGIWYFYRMATINQEHAQFGTEALQKLIQIKDSDKSSDEIKNEATKAIDYIKNEARKRQAKKGVYNDIHKIIQIHKKRNFCN